MDKIKVLKNKIIFLFLLFLILLTFIHFLPLSLHPINAMPGTIDCLLNTWILSHVHHQLFSRPLQIFEANIFYPHPQTLTYSESLFPQAIFSIPIYYLSKNPILAYNFVFFLAYLLNGISMFLLVRYLTKNNVIGMACGIMFAFNAFNFNHMTHLQLLYAWPTPLAFLYLHKFFTDRRLKHSVLFSFFFAVQALCCIYYGLFFLSILALILPVCLLIYRQKMSLSVLGQLIIPLGFAGAVLIGFSLPYKSLFETFRFQRGLTKGADLVNYLAVNPNNVFLSKLLTPLGRHEYFLCPGIAALILASLFIIHKKKLFRLRVKYFRIAILGIVLLSLVMIILTKVTGGFSLDLGLFRLTAHNVAKQVSPVLIIGLLLLLIGLVRFILRPVEGELTEEHRYFFLYLSILCWALLLSFGNAMSFLGDSTSIFPLPFKWFYEHFPGFKGIRVPSRYAEFVIFSTVILAGFGMKYLRTKFDRKRFVIWGTIGLLLFLNLEYLSLPQRIRFIPIKNDIPPTYRWLEREVSDGPVVELPFHKNIGRDAVYMYFSIFHRKKMINGYSGFFPPAIFYIRKIFETFPSPASLDILNALGIKYVILHPKMYRDKKGERVVRRIREDFFTDLSLKKAFSYASGRPHFFEDELGEDFVYEVEYQKDQQRPMEEINLQEISPKAWTIESNRNQFHLSSLKDDDLSTVWSTSRTKRTGDFLVVEFDEPTRVRKASLFLGESLFDYALRIRVETSLDGKEWRTFRYSYSPGEFTKNLISSPLSLVQNIRLRGEKIRFLKIIQVGKDKNFWWSVAELKIYRKQD